MRGVVSEQVVPPKSGVAFEVQQGHVFRVTDLEGQQVVDMAVFNGGEPSEKLSLTYTRSRARAGQTN